MRQSVLYRNCLSFAILCGVFLALLLGLRHVRSTTTISTRNHAAALLTNPSGEEVALSGVIESREMYGPPGFGETPARDKKVPYYVLRLNHKMSFRRMVDLSNINTNGIAHIVESSEVQLVSTSDRIDEQLSALLGSMVVVRGPVYEPRNAYDRTDILMSVGSVVKQTR